MAEGRFCCEPAENTIHLISPKNGPNGPNGPQCDNHGVLRPKIRTVFSKDVQKTVPETVPKKGGEVISPGEAVMKLSRIGFRFRLDGAAVKVCFEGEQPPDPAAVAAVASLLTLVKAHKDEVRYFLRSFCPKCGRAVFGIFSGVSCCMA